MAGRVTSSVRALSNPEESETLMLRGTRRGVPPRARRPVASRPSPAPSPSKPVPWSVRLGRLWHEDRTGVAIDALRVGLGMVWSINLVFVVDPGNQFFRTFASTAISYAPQTLGGPAVAQFVAAHAAVFAWVTAILTGYLAVALLLGLTTRLACWVGALFSVALLLTQFVSTFGLPGGTSVGPHPLYLVMYVILVLGGAGRYFAVDRWVWATGRARFPRLSRWISGPRA